MTRPQSIGAVRTVSARRGFALLAALWLVVMISAAGLQFAEVARERRQLGLTSADRTRDMAALDGAAVIVQAQLESEMPRLGSDPWRNLAQRFVEPLAVGIDSVAVQPIDLGTVINVNLASELELTTLIESITGDAPRARALAQSILDWRDADTLPRALGAESERYVKAGLSTRPANGAFRTLDELQDVWGVTPDLYAQLRPFVTVDGAVRRINLNAAPEPVLRTLPGMTEPLLTAILALRNRNRRVESIPALLSAVRSAARPGSGERDALARSLTDAVTLDVSDVAVQLTVSNATTPRPPGLNAVMHRNRDGSVDVTSRRWLP